MSEYKVLITETWKRAVTVDAESREEAEAAVCCQYKNGEYALASVDSDGVSFSAQYPEQQVELSYGKLWELFRKAERGGIHVSGYITFRADSFSTAYSERSRTYAVSSDNKAFQPNMGGYSIYARCLRDGPLRPTGAVYGCGIRRRTWVERRALLYAPGGLRPGDDPSGARQGARTIK